MAWKRQEKKGGRRRRRERGGMEGVRNSSILQGSVESLHTIICGLEMARKRGRGEGRRGRREQRSALIF